MRISKIRPFGASASASDDLHSVESTGHGYVSQSRASISDPSNDETVGPSFRADGSYENPSSNLSARITLGAYAQGSQVVTNNGSWYADFTNVPPGNGYDLSVTASAETGDDVGFNVDAGLCAFEYADTGRQRTKIIDPDILVQVTKGNIAGLVKPAAEYHEVTVKATFQAAVAFYPPPKSVIGSATDVNGGAPVFAKVSLAAGGNLEPTGAQMWLFLFEGLRDGTYNLLFDGETTSVQATVTVDNAI